MIFSKVLPVPQGVTGLLEGYSLPCGPHVAQITQHSWRGDDLATVRLTVEAPTPPDWGSVEWAKPRQPKGWARYAAAFVAAMNAGMGLPEHWENEVAGDVFAAAEGWTGNNRAFYTLLPGGAFTGEIWKVVVMRTNHDISGPQPWQGNPQTLTFSAFGPKAGAPLIPWDVAAPVGPQDFPGVLLAEYKGSWEGTPWASEYGAATGGNGINPLGLIGGNKYLGRAVAMEQLSKRTTWTLFQNGGPIEAMPKGAKYHTNGPASPFECVGWTSSGDPQEWRQQDYSKNAWGAIDSQHGSREDALTWFAADMGGEPWAINYIRCQAQTIVLNHEPLTQSRFGREDAARIRKVAQAVRLTAPGPMRKGWIDWLLKCSQRIQWLAQGPMPIDADPAHPHLKMYGYESSPALALSAPWELMLLVDALASVRNVLGDWLWEGNSVEDAASFVAQQLTKSYIHNEARWPYKQVRAVGTAELLKNITEHSPGNPNNDQEFYQGLLHVLWRRDIGWDFTGATWLGTLAGQMEAWANAKGKSLAQALTKPHTDDAWPNFVFAQLTATNPDLVLGAPIAVGKVP